MASDRRSRATHWKAHVPCISRQVARPEQVPSSPKRNLRRQPRKPATRDAAGNVSGNENAKQRRPRTAPKGTKLPPSSAPPMPACLLAHPAALQRAQRRHSATGAAVWPRQGPPQPYRSASGRSTPCCGGSSRTSPTLAPRPPAPASRPDSMHSYPPSRRTGRSYLLRPLQRGAPQRHHRCVTPCAHQRILLEIPTVLRALGHSRSGVLRILTDTGKMAGDLHAIFPGPGFYSYQHPVVLCTSYQYSTTGTGTAL